MFKEEIIDKITKYFKLTSFEAEEIYNDIFACIIDGVSEDNIAEITNLGEFIVKLKSDEQNGGSKKTIEFLPTSTLDEEINERGFEISSTPRTTDILGQTPYGSSDEIKYEEPAEDKKIVEDEIIRKRDEILHKITFPKPELNVAQSDEIKKPAEEITSPEAKQFDEFSHKTFSDYFTEAGEREESIKEEPAKEEAKSNEPVIPPLIPPPPPSKPVIPPAAVELHNEISQTKPEEHKEPEYTKPEYQDQASTETATETPGYGSSNGSGYENRAGDNSYYIWYKESEPNALDTQAMSYEYELLYQATKEAEYKSKIRIYITSFILFFSIVLLLLIFSPVFYKIFFTPKAPPPTESQEELPNFDEPSGTNNPPVNNQPPANNNQASVNTLPENQNTTNSGNNTTTNTNNQTQPKTEQPKTEQPTQNQPTVPEGLVKNDLGWVDSKNKVTYVQLENTKFAIQESAFNNADNANKRLAAIEKISGLKGAVAKVDTGVKGTWYRVRLGEFSTLAEAQTKAAEFRSKEKK